MNYHCIIGISYYLLLSDKISRKTKKHLLPFNDTKFKKIYNDNIN